MTIYCIGRNYAAHAAELGNAKPDEPVVFIKSTEPLHNPANVPMPAFTTSLHHEVEFVLKFTQDIPVSTTISKIEKTFDEIALGIDFTARDVQDQLKAQQLPWEKAKSFAGSCILSDFQAFNFDSWLNQQMELTINGQTKQSGNPSLMLFTLLELVTDLSKYFDIKKGDLLFTGTPAGVGPVVKGDDLVASLNGTPMLTFSMV